MLMLSFKKIETAVRIGKMALAPLLSLPFIFFLALLISALLYVIGSKIAPQTKKPKKTSAKIQPYACGEAMPARRFQVDIQRFFLYVTFFMIFDISAFILALSFNGGTIYPILFVASVAASLLTIIPVIGRKRE